MKLIAKHPLPAILLLFFVSRLINLTLLPIYVDEANYLDWGWRSLHLPNFLFYSLYDAKQPLLIWAFGLFETLLPDPLFAGRLVSILAGSTGLLGIYHVSNSLFDRRTGLIACLFYVIVPLFLFFDRQVLMETSIAAVGIWSFFSLNKFLTSPSVKTALRLGLLLAGGVWIKNSALLFVVAALAVIAYHFLLHRQNRFSLLTYTLLTLTLSSILLSPLFFQSAFWNSFHLNSRYSLGFQEIIRFPLSHWATNLLGILDISFFFLTPLVFIASLFGIAKSFSKVKYFLIWFLIPLLQVLFTTRTLNIRYTASFLLPLLVFAAAALRKKPILVVVASILPIFISCLQLIDPPAYFQLLSRFTSYSYVVEYVTGPLTGYLANDIVNYAKTISPGQPIYLTFAVNSGNFEAALIDYFHKDPFIKTSYLDSRLFPEDLKNYRCLSAPLPVYFVAREQQTAGLGQFLEPIHTITPSHGIDYATIYTLKNTNCQDLTISITPS